jgi:hypothetical protein
MPAENLRKQRKCPAIAIQRTQKVSEGGLKAAPTKFLLRDAKSFNDSNSTTAIQRQQISLG